MSSLKCVIHKLIYRYRCIWTSVNTVESKTMYNNCPYSSSILCSAWPPILLLLYRLITNFQCFHGLSSTSTSLFCSSSVSLLLFNTAVCCPRRSGGCRGGAGSWWWPAGDAGAQTHGWSVGHGWRLHSDSIRSAQNCKLCFSTTGYYLQQFPFLKPKRLVWSLASFPLTSLVPGYLTLPFPLDSKAL